MATLLESRYSEYEMPEMGALPALKSAPIRIDTGIDAQTTYEDGEWRKFTALAANSFAYSYFLGVDYMIRTDRYTTMSNQDASVHIEVLEGDGNHQRIILAVGFTGANPEVLVMDTETGILPNVQGEVWSQQDAARITYGALAQLTDRLPGLPSTIPQAA